MIEPLVTTVEACAYWLGCRDQATRELNYIQWGEGCEVGGGQSLPITDSQCYGIHPFW